MNHAQPQVRQWLMFCLGLVLTFHVLPAAAGDKIGNGGAIWACESAQSEFLSGQLLDLFEAKTEFGYELDTPIASDPYQISSDLLNRFKQDWPEFALKVSPHMDAVLANKRFVEAVVEKIDDAKPPISPLPIQCKGGSWNFVQIANFKDDGQLLIRQDLWNAKELASIDKAALLWHEAVYRWLRNDYQDETSTRARKIVGLAFSTLPTDQISIEVRKVLWAKTPNPLPPSPPAPVPTPGPFPYPPPFPFGSFICLMNETLHDTVYMSVANSEEDAKTTVEMNCKNGPLSKFCSDMSLECEPLIPMATWQCKASNNFSGHLFIGRVHAELEAKYNAEKACKDSSPEKEHACTDRRMMDCTVR